MLHGMSFPGGKQLGGGSKKNSGFEPRGVNVGATVHEQAIVKRSLIRQLI